VGGGGGGGGVGGGWGGGGGGGGPPPLTFDADAEFAIFVVAGLWEGVSKLQA